VNNGNHRAQKAAKAYRLLMTSPDLVPTARDGCNVESCLVSVPKEPSEERQSAIHINQITVHLASSRLSTIVAGEMLDG
jgi:hypothetical protein